MPAYAIFIREQVIDPVEMANYTILAREARGRHRITPRVYYGAVEALEGPAIDGVVVLEFENMDAARAWYDSPEYQAAKGHRLKGANYRVMLADGVETRDT